jgi:hypothetical protein
MIGLIGAVRMDVAGMVVVQALAALALFPGSGGTNGSWGGGAMGVREEYSCGDTTTGDDG